MLERQQKKRHEKQSQKKSPAEAGARQERKVPALEMNEDLHDFLACGSRDSTFWGTKRHDQAGNLHRCMEAWCI